MVRWSFLLVFCASFWHFVILVSQFKLQLDLTCTAILPWIGWLDQSETKMFLVFLPNWGEYIGRVEPFYLKMQQRKKKTSTKRIHHFFHYKKNIVGAFHETELLLEQLQKSSQRVSRQELSQQMFMWSGMIWKTGRWWEWKSQYTVWTNKMQQWNKWIMLSQQRPCCWMKAQHASHYSVVYFDLLNCYIFSTKQFKIWLSKWYILIYSSKPAICHHRHHYHPSPHHHHYHHLEKKIHWKVIVIEASAWTSRTVPLGGHSVEHHLGFFIHHQAQNHLHLVVWPN